MPLSMSSMRCATSACPPRTGYGCPGASISQTLPNLSIGGHILADAAKNVLSSRQPTVSEDARETAGSVRRGIGQAARPRSRGSTARRGQ